MFTMRTSERNGVLWATASFVIWGVFPIYWKLLSHRPSSEILAHRFIWAFAFYAILLFWKNPNAWPSIKSASRRDWLLSASCALLLGSNWYIYIHAVNTNRILEGSLAYFLSPLFSAFVGIAFFGERPHWLVKASLAIAASGVALKVILVGSVPILALSMAITFCIYGIVKRRLSIPARTSSFLEGAVGVVPAILFTCWIPTESIDAKTWALFILSGPGTGLPLFLFSYAAQRVSLISLGIMQFISPSIQFLVGVFLYAEAFGQAQALSFGLIWGGISLYLIYLLRSIR
jgi:chloramphenicol-sensitive protein RarD